MRVIGHRLHTHTHTHTQAITRELHTCKLLVRGHYNTNSFGQPIKQIIIRPVHAILARSRTRSGIVSHHWHNYHSFTRHLNRVFDLYSPVSVRRPAESLSALWCYRFPDGEYIIIVKSSIHRVYSILSFEFPRIPCSISIFCPCFRNSRPERVPGHRYVWPYNHA